MAMPGVASRKSHLLHMVTVKGEPALLLCTKCAKKSGKFGNEHTTAAMLPMMVVAQPLEVRSQSDLNRLPDHQKQAVGDSARHGDSNRFGQTIQQRKQDMTELDKDLPLRADLARLDRLLGEVLHAQEGRRCIKR
jgi:hypothetical protein